MATEKVTVTLGDHRDAELFGVAFGMALKTFLGLDQRKKENATCKDVSNQDVSNKQTNEKKAQPVARSEEEEEAVGIFWVQCGCGSQMAEWHGEVRLGGALGPGAAGAGGCAWPRWPAAGPLVVFADWVSARVAARRSLRSRC